MCLIRVTSSGIIAFLTLSRSQIIKWCTCSILSHWAVVTSWRLKSRVTLSSALRVVRLHFCGPERVVARRTSINHVSSWQTIANVQRVHALEGTSYYRISCTSKPLIVGTKKRRCFTVCALGRFTRGVSVLVSTYFVGKCLIANFFRI